MQKKTAFATWNSYVQNKAKRYPKLLLLMKISIINCTIMLFTAQLFAANPSKGQAINSSSVPFGLKRENLKEALRKLGERSGFIFVYPSEKVDQQNGQINLQKKTRTIAATLDSMLVGSGLGYKQQGERTVVLFTVINDKLSDMQQSVISGYIIDENKNPLSGVVIRAKGSLRTPSISDIRGVFQITLQQGDESLEFTHIGFKTKTVLVKNLKSPAMVVMQDAVGTLDEVQVTAYGSTTKRLNTGDQTTITAKEIEKYPSGNVLVALQGSVPGLLITQNTGTPGSTFNVNIRGLNSVSAGSDPFYVIDGVPYSGGSFTSFRGNSLSANATQAYDALSFINPQDIESINVLKDADATAIYGSRAANGVILITTKKGKTGKPRFDINVFTGVRQMTRSLELLDTKQYLEVRREAKLNDNNAAVLPSDYDLNGTWDMTRYTNFPELFLGGTAHSNNAQASISGGNSEVQYLVSANYRNTSNLQKFSGGNDQNSSLHFNLNTGGANTRFTMAFTGGFTYNKNDMPPTDLLQYIGILAPNSPALFKEDGTLNFENNTFGNPLTTTKLLANTSVYNLTSSLVLGYKILPQLTFQTTLGYNKQSVNEVLANPTPSMTPAQLAAGAKASSRFTEDNKNYWSIEPLVTYAHAIGKGNLSATVGWSLQKQHSDAQQLQATGYSSDLLLGSVTSGTTISGAGLGVAINDYKYTAAFGRVNYNLDDRYILNLSGRYDGSSRFGENRRFHFFPAAGAAWIFSSEDFFKNHVPFVSFGKLRFSYGITGNDQISNYSYYTNYSLVSGAAYQGIPGVSPNNLPNPDLSWETVAKSNIGIELKFLKDRIGLETNYFINNTSDVILSSALASITGFTGVSENQPGKIQNKGVDITLNVESIKNDDFTWSTTFLFTRQRNKLKDYPNLPPARQIILGQAVNVQQVFRYAGVNQQTGFYEFYDVNGKTTSNPNQVTDRTGFVNTTPNYFGSVSNTFSYKGFSLSFMFRYVKQIGTSVRGVLSGSVFPGYPGYNIPPVMLDRWQKPGDVATYQKFSTNINALIVQSQLARSDAGYGDASFIRLQNASLGYQFPFKIANSLKLKNLRIYANGENLATISGYGILDPENQSLSRVGPLRTIVLGIQASL